MNFHRLQVLVRGVREPASERTVITCRYVRGRTCMRCITILRTASLASRLSLSGTHSLSLARPTRCAHYSRLQENIKHYNL